jgi:rubrerythrin
MQSPADQIEIIGMMAAHESAVADLYEAYADQLPQFAEFFRALVEEEREHARLIVSFADKVRKRAVQVSPGRFNSHAILTSLDYVRQRLNDAQQERVSAMDALSTCKDIEESLIEREFFKILDEDAPDLREVLQAIASDTTAHREKVRQAWEQERQATR